MDETDKKWYQSKKFIGLAVGVVVTLILTGAGLWTMIAVPTIASNITNLITVSLATVNTCVGLYCVGQSAVDWKVSSTRVVEIDIDRDIKE